MHDVVIVDGPWYFATQTVCVLMLCATGLTAVWLLMRGMNKP